MMKLAENPNVHTVTQLNNRVSSYLEKKYHNIYVDGEVSSVQEYPSGHTYLVLKDTNSELPCVLFSYQKKQNFDIEIGMQLIVKGNVSLYEPKGRFQLIIKDFYLSGEGLFMMNINKLKHKLNDEGLFLDVHKQKIPTYPSKVGLITSLNGAVIQDVIKVFKTKAPSVQLVIKNTQIQGIHAVNNIIDSISEFNRFKMIDVILLCRGGGSIEDLNVFNNEKIARAIFNSNIPIITGIGHESDITIADFVSDYRASTPTAAAEKATFNIDSINILLDDLNKRLNFLIKNKLVNYKNNLESIKNSKGFINLNFKIIDYKNSINKYNREMLLLFKNRINLYKEKIKLYNSKIQNLNPENIIDKGYAIIKTKDNKIITSGENINVGQGIKVVMRDYYFDSIIKEKNINEE